jgi:hypothetical protein
MQDRPTMAELLEALEGFLKIDLLPQLAGTPAFHVRVAANVAAIVRRELELGPPAQAEELVRLEDLLSATGTLAELNAELCVRLRSQEVSLDDPALIEHLICTTLAKVEIDNPRYASLAEAKATWPLKQPGEELGTEIREDHESA